MKSRYGWRVPPEDARLTHVEAGSPMGELLRRYWQPVALSDELKDLPKRVRILCEDLVLFRTGAGKVGCLELHCSHRGTSLEWGRVEEAGIRCCYHGWLFDAEGRVVEMPCETADFCRKVALQHPAYPVHEFGGVIFLYMGPPEKRPLFPMYDVYDVRYKPNTGLKGVRLWGEYGVGHVKDCNWLQHYENAMDPWHVFMLHQMISGAQIPSASMQGKLVELDFERTPIGVRYRFVKDLPNGNRLVRHVECVLPNALLIPNHYEQGDVPKREDRATEFTWVVPADNEHVSAISMAAWPLENGEPREDWRPRTFTVTPLRPGSSGERGYEDRQRRPDDREAQEGQRPIAVHALEHLGHADRGVVMLRRALAEQLQRLERGEDPLNVVREDSANHRIRTHCWITVLSPEEAGIQDPAPV